MLAAGDDAHAFGYARTTRNRCLHKHGNFLPDTRRLAATRNFELRCHQGIAADLFNCERQVVIEFGRGGFGLVRIKEDTGVREAAFADEGEQFFKIFFRFTGVADDERGAERETGQPLREAVKQRERVRLGHAAAHCGQHRVGDMLERQIKVGAEARVAGEHGKHGVSQVQRIGVHQAEPDNVTDFVAQRGEQVRQQEFSSQVPAVAGGVLRDQAQFARADGDQLAGLADEIGDGPANLFAADARDRTEAAGVRATFGNFQIGGVRCADAQPRKILERSVALGRDGWPSRPLRRVRRIRPTFEQVAADFGEARVVGEAHSGVGGRKRGGNFRHVERALGEAAERNERPELAAVAQLRQFAQRCGGFFARVMNETAGIHKTDIGLRRIFRNQEARLDEAAEDAFGVHGVFRAAETDETDDGRLVGKLHAAPSQFGRCSAPRRAKSARSAALTSRWSRPSVLIR